MASAAFYWQDPREPLHEVKLLHNKLRVCSSEAAYWWERWEETKDIYAGMLQNTGGTYLGVSRRGRVAFLISPLASYRFGNGPTSAEHFPVMFLMGKMSPSEFADELESNKKLCSEDIAFHLVVADIASKSMFYISKKCSYGKTIEKSVVRPGFHHVSANGLDDSAHEDKAEIYKSLLICKSPLGNNTYPCLDRRGEEDYTVVRIRTTGEAEFCDFEMRVEYEEMEDGGFREDLSSMPRYVLAKSYQFRLNTSKDDPEEISGKTE